MFVLGNGSRCRFAVVLWLCQLEFLWNCESGCCGVAYSLEFQLGMLAILFLVVGSGGVVWFDWFGPFGFGEWRSWVLWWWSCYASLVFKLSECLLGMSVSLSVLCELVESRLVCPGVVLVVSTCSVAADEEPVDYRYGHSVP